MAEALIPGAGVGLLSNEVLFLVKKGRRCRESLKILAITLTLIQSQVEKLKGCGNDNYQAWLTRLEVLLKKAKSVIEEYCVMEGKRWRSVGYKYLKKSVVSSMIMDLDNQIRRDIECVNMVTHDVQATHDYLETCMISKREGISEFFPLDVVRASHDYLETCMIEKGEASFEFLPRDLPPNIVKFETDPFGELKTLIMGERYGSSDHVILGCRGVGGSGKTLLAKMLLNDEDVKAKFGEGSILWITVGNEAKVLDLYGVMGKFLKLNGYKRGDIEQQRAYLIEAFREKKILLILDDIWERGEQGHEMMHWLDVVKGKGSITLVTTRFDGVLTKAKASRIVHVSLLSEIESWRLFCYNAFPSGEDPSVEVETIAKSICKQCDGLPLALVVMGGTMEGKREPSQWRDALKALQYPNGAYKLVKERVYYPLELSYNELDDDLKKCFLYFAAFPEDYQIPTRMLCSMWHAEEMFESYKGEKIYCDEGLLNLVSLADRSMINLSRDGEFASIHDVLRNLALSVIRQAKWDWASACYFQPGRVLETLPQPKNRNVTRISLMRSTICDDLETLALYDLQVLLVSGLCKEGNEEKSALEHCSTIFLNNTKLCYVDFSETYLEKLPQGIEKLKVLKYLNLSGCSILKELPEGIKELKALTSLDLSECTSLKELPIGIKELKALTSLNLFGCSSLKELPEGIKELKALTFLDLSKCISLKKLPEGIMELKVLTYLGLSECTFLKELPIGIKEFKALTSLNLFECTSLEDLPEDIKKLMALTLTCEQCSSSDMMELKERSSKSFELEEEEALRIFEIDEPTDVDLRRLHCVGTPMNGNEIQELETLPFVNSSDEIQDEHGGRDKLEAEMIKVQAIDMDNADILVDLEKLRFEEIMECFTASVQGVAKFLRMHFGNDIQVLNHIQVFSHIQVFNRECGFLVDTLSRTIHDRLRYYNDMLRDVQEWNDWRGVVQETGVNDWCRISMNVTLCIVALTELERMFHAVVDLLTICSDENWWNTALELSNAFPSSSIPRWSRFSLAIRSCEWSMDIVDLAFHALQQSLTGASTLPGAVFKWSDKQLRMVLHIHGKPLYHNEGKRSLLDVTRELEGKDIISLIDKLEALEIVEEKPRKRLSNNYFSWKWFANADANILPIANMLPIANFLRKKLRGPIPEPSSLPDTFELDPSTLTFKGFIGSGGFATVRKSEWLGQTVAVKTINEVNRKQIKAEAAILASVQHPNVVRMIGWAFEENEKEAESEDEAENEDEAEDEDIAKTGHLVMELMQADLRKVIDKRCRKPAPKKSPFPLIVAIDIMLQIGEGMQYLREHRILHRDLKAKNVLLNECSASECGAFRKFPKLASLFPTKKYRRNCYYIAKLADFGTAKARRYETSFKTPNLGTGSWRAPEVLNVSADKYEWPADVYSFAMTCYEILTGRVPFDKVPPTKLHQHIVDGHRPSLDDVEMPALLRGLVKRCWETEPNKRPSFDEICKTLWQCKVEIILPGFRLQIDP